MRQRRVWVFGAVLILVAAGCSSSRHSYAPTTTAKAQNTGPDPYVIPAVITPAYVDAVFRVLNHVYGNATRSLFQANAVDSDVRLDLRSIFDDPLYGQELIDARQSLTTPRSDLKRPIGDVITTTKQVISRSPTCIFVETVSDFSNVEARPGPAASSEYWALATKQAADDPHRLNQTPWALAFNADYLTPTSIPNQCAGH
jgi:hypothetical protein